ncbi:MAG: HDIG domain-containing protein [Deltaproteobacteria bacterium]|nr:HDIG domain-containing protein [Deltaproteobacteria bacterium]
MDRESALSILRLYLTNHNLIKHSLATEACMKGLASRLGGDELKWGLCGLLHDIDYEVVRGNMKMHGIEGARILKEHGFDEEICNAVLSHNDVHGISPYSLMAKALFCVDPLTGLIVAATLVLPSKSINDLKCENLLNRFKEKNFAKGAKREIISKCKEYLDMDLYEFFSICLEATKLIGKDLGL